MNYLEHNQIEDSILASQASTTSFSCSGRSDEMDGLEISDVFELPKYPSMDDTF